MEVAPKNPKNRQRSSEGFLSDVGCLSVEDLRAGYRDADGVNPFQYDVVVDGVSFDVEPGEVLGIQGPNASGKSTLLSAIVDPKRRLSGSVQSGSSPLRPGMTAYIPQSAGETLSPWLTVGQEIALPLRAIGGYSEQDQKERVRDLISKFDIRLPLDRSTEALSGGQRVKVALLRGFAVPSIHLFVLDEPFEGLDSGSRGVVLDAIRKVADAGVPVLLTSHREVDLRAVGARTVQIKGSPVKRLAPTSLTEEKLSDTSEDVLPDARDESGSDGSTSQDALSRTSATADSGEGGKSKFGTLRLAGVGLGVAVWKMIALAVGDPGLLPGPFSVGASALDLLGNPERFPHFAMTVVRAAAGWGLASAMAIPVGIILGYDERIYSTVAPWLSLGRTLPIFVLIGPAIGIFPGWPELQRGFLIWLTLYLIALQSISAASAFAPRTRVRIARVFGASHWFRIRHVLLNETRSGIFSALEVILPLSVVVALVVEIFLIPDTGLATYVYNHLTDADLSMLFAHILLPGLVAVVAMWALRRVGSKEATQQRE